MAVSDVETLVKELRRLISYGASRRLTDCPGLGELLCDCLPPGVDATPGRLREQLVIEVNALRRRDHTVPWQAKKVIGDNLADAYTALFDLTDSDVEAPKRREKARQYLEWQAQDESWRRKPLQQILLWFARYLLAVSNDGIGYVTRFRNFAFTHDPNGRLLTMDGVWRIQAVRDGLDGISRHWRFNTDTDENVLRAEALTGLNGIEQTYMPSSGALNAMLRFPRPLDREQEHVFAERVHVTSSSRNRPYVYCIPAAPTKELRIVVRFAPELTPAEAWYFEAVSGVAMPTERDPAKMLTPTSDGLEYSILFRDIDPKLFYGIAWEWPESLRKAKPPRRSRQV